MNELLATLWDNMGALQFIRTIIVLIWTITKEVLIFIVLIMVIRILIMTIRLMQQKLNENKTNKEQE